MLKKEILIPALLGLGVYSQNCDVSLCNNTTMLLALAVLLTDHEEIEELKCKMEYEHCQYQPARHERHRCYESDCDCNCGCIR